MSKPGMVDMAKRNIAGVTRESKYGEDKLLKRLAAIAAAQRQRCENPHNGGYENYGARGVRFMFESVEVAARWMRDNLGEPPAAGYSVDRIDNNGDYEAGNLRWASRSEQMRNRRPWKLDPMAGRIDRLHVDRPDYSRESIRAFVKKGMTDHEILNKPKGRHSC